MPDVLESVTAGGVVLDRDAQLAERLVFDPADTAVRLARPERRQLEGWIERTEESTTRRARIRSGRWATRTRGR
ncbi:hypothetical protein [Rathayibacter sp. AY1H2]|uniref:hypothetical protein n=1 Tax=Rathayibacter sp. AY1H2 TaxID=2080566 RepID=UPI0035BE587C